MNKPMLTPLPADPKLLHGGIVHEPLERPEARDAVEQVLPRRHGILQVRQRADHRAGLVVRGRVLDERQDPGVLTLRVDALVESRIVV